MTLLDLSLWWVGVVLAFFEATQKLVADWGFCVSLNPLQKYRARSAFMAGLASANAKPSGMQAIQQRQGFFFQAGRRAASAPNPQNLPPDSLFRHALVEFENQANVSEASELIALASMSDQAADSEPQGGEDDETHVEQADDSADSEDPGDMDPADHDPADDDEESEAASVGASDGGFDEIVDEVLDEGE